MTFLCLLYSSLSAQTGVYSYGNPTHREGGIVLAAAPNGQGIYIGGYRNDSTLIMLVNYNGVLLNEVTFRASTGAARDLLTDFKFDRTNNLMVGTGAIYTGAAQSGGYVFQFNPNTFTINWLTIFPNTSAAGFYIPESVQDINIGNQLYFVYGTGNASAYSAEVGVNKGTGALAFANFFTGPGPNGFAATEQSLVGTIHTTARWGHSPAAGDFRPAVVEVFPGGGLVRPNNFTYMVQYPNAQARLYSTDVTINQDFPISIGTGDFTGTSTTVCTAFWASHDVNTSQLTGYEINLPPFANDQAEEVFVVPGTAGSAARYILFGEGAYQATGQTEELWMMSMNANGTQNWAFTYGTPAREFTHILNMGQQQCIPINSGSAQIAFTATTQVNQSEDVLLVLTNSVGDFDSQDLPCINKKFTAQFTPRVRNNALQISRPNLPIGTNSVHPPLRDPNLITNVICGGAFPCFAATDPNYNQILVPTTYDITTSPSGTQTWAGKYYVAADVVVDGIILDVTQTDVVFDPCTRITFINGGRLRANNSTFRPCDELQSWEGLYFTSNQGGTASGVIDECVFKNAVSAIDIAGNPFGLVSDYDLRITNNLFVNCQRGVNVGTGVPVILNEGITGNTFTIDERLITWSQTDASNNCFTYMSNAYMGIVGNSATFNGQVSQNDFMNTSDVLGTTLEGIVWSRSNGTISLNNFTNCFRAILFRSCTRSSIENNRVELTQLFNPFQSQIVVGNSAIIWVTGNQLANSTETGGINFNGAAISVENSEVVNVKENTVHGFSNGIQMIAANNTTVSENHITNTNAVAIYVGDGRNDSISCNVISARYPTVAGFSTLGVYYIHSQTAAPSLNIKGNCIMNTDMAIAADNISGAIQRLPRIHNNYLYNYRDFGVVSTNFNGSIGSGIGTPADAGRNSFISNNILGGAVDIEPNGQPLTSYGDYGINTIGMGVTLIGNGMYNSITSCSRQIGTVSSTIGTGEICDLFMANIDGSFWRISQGDYSDFGKDYFKGNEGMIATAILRKLALEGQVQAAERFETWISNSDRFTTFYKAYARYHFLDATQQTSAALNLLPYLEALDPAFHDFVTVESIRLNILLSGRTFAAMTTEEAATLEALDNARQTFADDARALLNLHTGRHPHIVKPVTIPYYEKSARTITVNEPTIQLYPNPATAQVQVQYVLTPGETATLRVLDATGRILLSTDLDAEVSSTTLDISSLTAGMYFVSLAGEKGGLQSAKLIVR